MIKKKREKRDVGERIFPKSQITPLALRWRELVERREDDAAHAILNEIITLSTPMFASYARATEITSAVQLDVLVAAAQEKVVKWLLAWDCKRNIHNWFTKCSHNAFLSELQKVQVFRDKYHCTSDNLEQIHGVEDHAIEKKDMARELLENIKANLYGRWGSAQEKLAIQLTVECIVMDLDNHDRNNCQRAVAYATGIPMETARFFYSWSLSALRDINYNRAYIPFTEEDITRHTQSYTNFVDLYEYMTHDQIKHMIATKGGQRIHIPTLAKIKKLKEAYAVARDIHKSDLDPDSVAKVGAKHKKSAKTATECYEQMVEQLRPDRSGEHKIYE